MDMILWLSLQFEPVQETNLFLLTLATFTGLWLTKKRKEITAYDFIQSCDIE